MRANSRSRLGSQPAIASCIGVEADVLHYQHHEHELFARKQPARDFRQLRVRRAVPSLRSMGAGACTAGP